MTRLIAGAVAGIVLTIASVVVLVNQAVDSISPIAYCSTTPGTLQASVPSPLNGIFTESAAHYELEPRMVAIVYYSENGQAWREPPPPYGKGPPWRTSPARADGPFQFTPPTWMAYRRSNPLNPDGSVRDLKDSAYAAAHYLKDLGAKKGMPFGSAADPHRDGTFAKVMGGYNAGPAGNFYNKETQRYISGATAQYARLGATNSDPTIVAASTETVSYCSSGAVAGGPLKGTKADVVTTTLPGCPYTGPAGGTRGDQPGLVKLRSFLQSQFGSGGVSIFSCRTTSLGNVSMHAEGRAHDAAFNANIREQEVRGDAAFKWLIDNAALVGVQQIIWKHQQWNVGKGLIPYPSSDHFDHIHVGLNWDGALAKTPFFNRGGTPTPKTSVSAISFAPARLEPSA